jgi:hypothetical protein
MRVAFFHGLESPHISEKNKALRQKFDFVYDPPMQYTEPGLFDKVLKEVKKNKIDLLIGSSMGGWFAYCVSTHTGIPTLLFNPAFHSRPIEPQISLGNRKATHTVVLGTEDKVILPPLTQNWVSKNGIGTFNLYYESNAHRTPINIFNKWLEQKMKMNEEWSLESPGDIPDLSFLPFEAEETLVPNFLTKRPPSGNLVIEDESEIDAVRKSQKNLSDQERKFIVDAHNAPYDLFYHWLILRGEKPKMSDIRGYWHDVENNRMISDLKKSVKRERPYNKYSDVKKPEEIELSDYSFPSGHSYGAYYIAINLSKKYPHLEGGLQNLADRIAKSRIQAGVHYPSDVQAGKELAFKLTR